METATPREYAVYLTSDEMQYTANALAGFYRMCTNEKLNVDWSQTVALLKVLEKFKLILNAPSETTSNPDLGVDQSGPASPILNS